MSEITLGGIAEVIREELKPVNRRLDSVESRLASVESSVSLLDGIAKDVKTLLDEKSISAARFDRLEKWARMVGEKIGVKLEL